MGVWIETDYQCDDNSVLRSHPAWVCGLKLSFIGFSFTFIVTPCVGVWIETLNLNRTTSDEHVTPCVGVWIETNPFWR